jgi:phenylpropionate dioxygenase-like ring-hydroxylating dioxygenase large terminal subunit
MSDVLETAYGGVAPSLERAVSLPREAFTDPAVHLAEMTQVLARGWVAVARESDLSSPGDYRTVDLAGAPLVAVRGDDGEIRVLSRVCRHRGAPVVEGAGNVKAFTCPYHLWRYGFDGRLQAAPAMQGSAVFARDACALPQAAVERWGGWVFANLDRDAAPLAPQLEGLGARLAPLDPASLITADVVEYDSPWNWKLLMENFLESYHHVGPHAGSLQQTHPGLGTYAGEGGDAYAVLENPGLDGQAPFVVAAVFPVTLMFFTEGAPPLGAWYEIDRIELGRFRLRIHLLAPPDLAGVDEFVAGYRAQIMAIHEEDIAICQATWRGVASPLYRPGPLSPLEACIWRFHRHLQARLLGR